MSNGAWGPHLRSGRTKQWATGTQEAEKRKSQRNRQSSRRATRLDRRLFTDRPRRHRRRRAAGKNRSPNCSESRQPFGVLDADNKRAKISAGWGSLVRLQLVTFGARVARKSTARIGCATKARAKSRQDAGGTLPARRASSG